MMEPGTKNNPIEIFSQTPPNSQSAPEVYKFDTPIIFIQSPTCFGCIHDKCGQSEHEDIGGCLYKSD